MGRAPPAKDFTLSALSQDLGLGTKNAKGAKRARELAVQSEVSWRRMGGQFWKFERPTPDLQGGCIGLKGAKGTKKSRQFVVRLSRSGRSVG